MSLFHLLPVLCALFFSTIFTQTKALTLPQELYNFSQNLIPFDPISPSSSSSCLLSCPITPSPSSILPTTSPLVPAFFIIGDSSVDCGTNNFLGTFARADRPPYGRDFDTHLPTGRFSNGRIPVDYLALRLGLPFVPSYLGQMGSAEDMAQGVNYASAGAGVIFTSGSELGQRIPLTHQIQQFTDTLQTFILSLGEDATADLISSSVFYVSIGTNDYIHYYLRNVSNVQNLYLPWSFNRFLASSIVHEIKNLHDMGVRKVVVMGLPPIGCAPHYLYRYDSTNGECVKEINDMILEFNFVMRYMIEELGHELPDAMITFCDMYEGSMDIIENYEHYGFNVTTDACCGLGKYNGWIMCIAPEMACSNATNHIWWDQFHPTDVVNGILADNVWNSSHTKMCYPMTLEEMVDPIAK